jgi:hypothetical protein
MVKFAHLLVLSALIIWLAGSGCVGNGTSEVKNSGVDQNAVEAGNGAPVEDLEIGLTQAEIQKLIRIRQVSKTCLMMQALKKI